MRNRPIHWALALLLLALSSSHLLAQQRNLAVERADARVSDKRVALVIGNSAYKASPLKNPVNDAKDMAAKLRDLGFEVVERTNLSARQIGATLREFRSKLAPGGVAVVFYAGHGLQFRGENYLPAVDSEIGGEEDLPNQSLAVRQIMEILDDVKTRLNLVFLDACRNNPYARRFRSANDGLARVTTPAGTLISFATRPGSVAADGSGRNGLYTGALLEQMNNPGQPIEQLLKRVVTGVKAASNGNQEPWMEGSIEGEFCFGECATSVSATAAPPVDQNAAAYELAFWDSIKASRNFDDFKAYLEQYPNGRFAPLARNRLAAGLASAPATLAIASTLPEGVRTPIVPAPALPAVPTGGGVSLDDIAKQQESRAQWDAWQAGMKADYDKVLALNAAADLQAAAWERFLASYAQDNPYSGEDAELRAEAARRKEAAELESARQKQVAENRRRAAARQRPQAEIAPQREEADRTLGEPTQLALAPTGSSAIQQATLAGTTSSTGAGGSFRDCDVCPEMMRIPAGSFTMGSPTSELERRDAEGPQHEVRIVRTFAAGKYEVTFDEWDACVGARACPSTADKSWGRGRRPAIYVSWQDAKKYVEWLSRRTGKKYRLLSEAEWEYVARAGTSTTFSVGNRITPQQANYDSKVAYAGSPTASDQGKTVPVGSYAANGFGLHDMHGNVWEWTEDCWNDSYNGAPSNGSAWVAGDCGLRVLRGGSWDNNPRDLRAASRNRYNTTNGYTYVGLRVARTDEAAEAEAAPRREEADRTLGEPMQLALAPTGSGAIQQARPAGTISSAGAGGSFRDCDVCPEMMLIPAGSFTMGSPTSELERRDAEGPQHEVRIVRAFAAGKYEVTFDEWDACVGARACPSTADKSWGRGRRPAIYVSWQDAKKYVEWLSRKTGKKYRLLSEAEWEYVARAGTSTAFSVGNRITPQQANYDSKVAYAGSPTASDQGKTVPVGSYAANDFGLHDMHGNVWEWTEDCWNDNYNGAPSDGSAWVAGDCGLRVLRGGSWDNNPRDLRAASRNRYDTTKAYTYVGLRVARTD